MLPGLRKFITDNNLIGPGNRVLLTVSGGIDSMVMAHLFLNLHYEMAIAHCNFTLRGPESDSDEELVRDFAEKHSIPFFSVRFDTKNYASANGISIQMAARELRYEWFEKIRSENNYDRIAVAHNLNDDIETFLINLTRGTGLAGLSGMKPLSGKIIRPLLFAPRPLISEYCKNNKIDFREDKSNSDTKYTRNKIRHEIIPVFKEINPSIEKTLTETAGRFSEINEIVGLFTEDIRNRITETREGEFIIKVSPLESYLGNRSVLFELFKQYGIAGPGLDDLINVIKGRTGSILFTDHYRIVKNRQELIVSEKRDVISGPLVCDTIEKLLEVPGIYSAECIPVKASFEIPRERSAICLDFEKLVFPLLARRWKAGDYFFPLGMNKKKKLSDYFVDNKYSLSEKEQTIILESEGEITCLIGGRADNRFRINPETKNALLIRSRAFSHH